MIALAGLLAFLRAERRQDDRLVQVTCDGADPAAGAAANRVVAVSSAIGFVVGFALFGALTYLPLFQQAVRGASPTASVCS